MDSGKEQGLTPEGVTQSLTEASKNGLFVAADVRPSIKLKPGAPKIAVCIPMGDKDCPDIYTDPETGDRFVGEVINPRTGKPVSALHRSRASGLVPVEWLLNAWQIVPPLLTTMTIMVRKGVLSAQARNEMTYSAIEMGAQYIFYWDDDTVIPSKTLLDMHNVMERNPDIGIITGVYTTREEINEPLVYKHHGQGAYWHFDPTEGHVEDVFAAGAGCMMARTEALLDVKRILGGEWWQDEQDIESVDAGHGKIMWGHDIRFCRRMWLTHQRWEYGDPQPGPAGLEDIEKTPTQRWRVALAGWIQCAHFDVQKQKMFTMPADAPCFKDKNTQTYWDHVWREEGHSSPRHYPELYDRIVGLVPIGSDVIDIGCGIGILMDRLIKQSRCNCYGIDISRKAIAMLRERWMNGEVCDVTELSEKLASGKEGTTVFVSTETIEHLSDEKLEAMFAATAKGKLCIFSTPEGDLKGTPDGEHVQIWTAETLGERMKPHFKWIRVEKLVTDTRPDNPYLIAIATNQPEMESLVCPRQETLSGSVPDLPLTGPTQSERIRSSKNQLPPTSPIPKRHSLP